MSTNLITSLVVSITLLTLSAGTLAAVQSSLPKSAQQKITVHY